tara:strand:+ start:262 stop:777 length:516 start_codon:yes stop_codon:yes gene_type:complete
MDPTTDDELLAEAYTLILATLARDLSGNHNNERKLSGWIARYVERDRQKRGRPVNGLLGMSKETDRRNWASEHDVCWICGERDYRGFPLETHEMERRSQAPTRWMQRCNYFRTCKICHMDKLASMAHARQLSYKQARDPENYDLQAWLKIRDPDLHAPNRVTQEDVDVFNE